MSVTVFVDKDIQSCWHWEFWQLMFAGVVNHKVTGYLEWASINKAGGRPVRAVDNGTLIFPLEVDCVDEEDAILFKLTCL